MSLKEEEKEAMKEMSYSQDMPMIPFDETYAINHMTHRFNPDCSIPLLTLVSSTGRVLVADAIPDIENCTDLEDIKEKWLPILNQDFNRKKKDGEKE